jgi:hypothetical protein
MRPYCPKRTVDRYKKAGYSDQAIEHLEYLESRCDCLCLLLEEYQNLQPEGGLFSEGNIAIIARIHELYGMIHEEEELLAQASESIAEYYEEIDSLVNGKAFIKEAVDPLSCSDLF